MSVQAQYVDDFLERASRLITSPYRSLDFACLAARRNDEYILLSGKAVLGIEPVESGAQVFPLVQLNGLVAYQGTIAATTLKHLADNLRNGWVVKGHPWQPVRLCENGTAFNWIKPVAHSIDQGSGGSARWSRAYSLIGNSQNIASLPLYSDWAEIDNLLRRNIPAFNGFDSLCAKLGLPARRDNLTPSFRISAALPARFDAAHVDRAKKTLEIDVECFGVPDLMIEWLPEHDLQNIGHQWLGGKGGRHHISLPLPTAAENAELILSFDGFEPADTKTIDLHVRDVRALADAKPTVETPFHTYTLRRPVGQGGSGTVFDAEDEDGRHCAVKRLDADKLNRERNKRFVNKVKICKNATHKNIVRVLDEGFTTVGRIKAPFYVMPFYPLSLRSLIKSGIPEAKVLLYFRQILDGVEAAHLRNVWHRDLKPENILFDPKTENLAVADFGIAHFEEEDVYTAIETKSDAKLANFRYAAPEQRVRGRSVDHRSDIYALGLMLNEMFTGEVLQGTGYKRIAALAPAFEYLDEVVDLMAQQSPENRPISIDAIKELMRARGDEQISRQKLSVLRNTVIPASEIDDPLIIEPIHVKPVDYRDGKIKFELSQSVNPTWAQAFADQAVYQYPSGLSPQNFAIDGKAVELLADENLARSAPEYLNRYIQGATALYKRNLEEIQRRSDNNRSRALQNQITEEEKRRRMLALLKGEP